LDEKHKVDLNLRFLGSRSFIDRMEGSFGISNIRNRRGRPPKINK
jgi:hypothetical protein